MCPRLDAIVLKALHKDPLDRYQTAAEMRADLKRALAGQQVQALLPDPLHAEGQRTELMRAAAVGGASGGSPPLLAPPVRSVPAQEPGPGRVRAGRGGWWASSVSRCSAWRCWSGRSG